MHISELIFFLIHIFCMIIMAVLIRAGRLKAPAAIIPLAAFMPVIGELLILFVHEGVSLGFAGKDKDKINRGKRTDLFSDSGFFNRDTRDVSIPLEDALIIHRGRARQTILRNSVLHQTDTKASLLRQASRSTDPEIVHFATTAMAHADTKNERIYNDLSKKLETAQKKEDQEAIVSVLDTYISALEHYLANAYDRDPMLSVRQHRIIELLKERVRLEPDASYFEKLADQALNEGNFSTAAAAMQEAEWRSPEDPELWILRFRVAYMKRDREMMNQMMEDYCLHEQHRNAHIMRIISIFRDPERSADEKD